MVKLITTKGSYVGFLNPTQNGRLLLVRRTSTHSIIPGVSFKGCWELPGGAEEEADQISYNYSVEVAFAKARDKVGIDVPPQDRPFLGPFYGTDFKGPAGYDEGQVVPVVSNLLPTLGETMWVDPTELDGLAQRFIPEDEAKKRGLPEADGLMSGKGKRMYLMAMSALVHSPNQQYHLSAVGYLQTWR